MSKNKRNITGIVYSTDPGFVPQTEDSTEPETLAPGVQPLRIRLDTKQRAGKAVTLVDRFTGLSTDLEKNWAKNSGTIAGGRIGKDGRMRFRGDHRDKVLQWLHKNGYVKSYMIFGILGPVDSSQC